MSLSNTTPKAERIAILLPNWIGDCVMATPMLRAIRQRYRSPHEIIGIIQPYVAAVLDGTSWLDHTIPYDRKSLDPAQHFAAVVRKLQQFKLDKFVLTPNSLSSAWLAWRSGARERIGYARDGRSMLLTCRLQAPKLMRKYVPVPAVDYYLKLAYALDCPEEPRRVELATIPDERAAANAVWRRMKFDRADGVVVFSTGSAFGVAKHWPDEYFVELARRIVETSDAAVLIICGPAEREAAAATAAAVNHPRVKSLAGESLSVGLSKACVERARLLVATDSGPRHFGAAFNVPVVSLFGPTDPRWTITYHANETHLFHPVDCGPCGERTCPLKHHKCMRDLTVERVYEAVAAKLGIRCNTAPTRPSNAVADRENRPHEEVPALRPSHA